VKALLVAVVFGALVLPAAAQRTIHAAVPPAARVSAAQQSWVETHVSAGQRSDLREVARTITRNGSLKAGARSRWSRVVTDVHRANPNVDIGALVQWVLRDAYLENTQVMRDHAQKVKFYNEQKKQIRARLKRLNERSAKLAAADPEADTAPAPPPGTKPPRAADPGSTVRLNPAIIQQTAKPIQPVARPERADVGVVDPEIRRLEAKLQTIGEDAQLANVDLQKWVQKEQQTVQMLSNISKQLHDSAMAVIRKIGS